MFNWLIFALCVLTTILLQILSNLANDYGDFKNGADSAQRLGPSRSVQAGKISSGSMKRAMILFTILSFVTGLLLLYVSLGVEQLGYFLIFLLLGILAIGAAITYTAGNNPYGYAGLGDVSVMIFFGWLGVAGTYYLFTKQLNWEIMLPASTCGFLATAVLNINNIRDIESDKDAGKKSIPVRIGGRWARIYHLVLLTAGLSCAILYVALQFNSVFQLLFLLVLPLLFINAKAVLSKKEPAELDPYLKQMALSSLLFVITFGIGQLLTLQ
jgi:1,4-dihydroxy-2-naphthoate octaprenyltransferase